MIRTSMLKYREKSGLGVCRIMKRKGFIVLGLTLALGAAGCGSRAELALNLEE